MFEMNVQTKSYVSEKPRRVLGIATIRDELPTSIIGTSKFLLSHSFPSTDCLFPLLLLCRPRAAPPRGCVRERARSYARRL